MNAVTIASSDQHYQITLDKKSFSPNFIGELMKWLEVERIVEKADFGEDIVELGEQIKRDWWAENKDWFLNEKR